MALFLSSPSPSCSPRPVGAGAVTGSITRPAGGGLEGRGRLRNSTLLINVDWEMGWGLWSHLLMENGPFLEEVFSGGRLINPFPPPPCSFLLLLFPCLGWNVAKPGVMVSPALQSSFVGSCFSFLLTLVLGSVCRGCMQFSFCIWMCFCWRLPTMGERSCP